MVFREARGTTKGVRPRLRPSVLLSRNAATCHSDAGGEGASAMKVVEEAPWSWMLLAEGDALFLSVVCGSVALSEIEFALNADETAGYARAGKAYLEQLAEHVIGTPGEFQLRNIPDFRDRPGVEEAIAAWRQTAAGRGKD
jgi:hypothetical protein